MARNIDTSQKSLITTSNSQSRRLWPRISGYALSFCLGATLAAWGVYGYMLSTQKDVPALADVSLRTSSPAKPNVSKPAPAAQRPAADPMTEIERINELNRQNAQRMAGMRPSSFDPAGSTSRTRRAAAPVDGSDFP